MQIRSIPIENHILELLSRNEKMSVKEIYQGLVNQFKAVISLPQLYKIIKKMTNDYVLVKKYGVVMLNAWWIRKITQDVSDLNQIIKPTSGIDLIKHGSTQYYNASSLREREKIQVDLTAKILQQQEPENLFFYDTHLYYIYGIEDLGTQEYDRYLSKRGKIFYVIGHDTFLDKHAGTLLKDKKIEMLFDIDTLFTKDGYSLRILGDYVLEAYMPDDISPLYERIFSTTTTIDSFDLAMFRIPFDMKIPCKLRITHDKHLANSLKQQLLNSFPAGLRRDV